MAKIFIVASIFVIEVIEINIFVLGRIREHVSCLTDLGKDLCRRLNFVSDVDIRVSFSNIRLAEDPEMDAEIIGENQKTPRPKPGTSQVVIRQQGPSSASRRSKKAILSYRRAPQRLSLGGRVRKSRSSAKRSPVKWVKTVTVPKTAFAFEPITPPSPQRLTVSSTAVGRAVGMVSSKLLKSPVDLERPERPRPPSPLTVSITTSAFTAASCSKTEQPAPSPRSSGPINIIKGRSATISAGRSGGGGSGPFVSSLPRPIRRRTLSAASQYEPFENFTFSPREYLKNRQVETIEGRKGNKLVSRVKSDFFRIVSFCVFFAYFH